MPSKLGILGNPGPPGCCWWRCRAKGDCRVDKRLIPRSWLVREVCTHRCPKSQVPQHARQGWECVVWRAFDGTSARAALSPHVQAQCSAQSVVPIGERIELAGGAKIEALQLLAATDSPGTPVGLSLRACWGGSAGGSPCVSCALSATRHAAVAAAVAAAADAARGHSPGCPCGSRQEQQR